MKILLHVIYDAYIFLHNPYGITCFPFYQIQYSVGSNSFFKHVWQTRGVDSKNLATLCCRFMIAIRMCDEGFVDLVTRSTGIDLVLVRHHNHRLSVVLVYTMCCMSFLHGLSLVVIHWLDLTSILNGAQSRIEARNRMHRGWIMPLQYIKTWKWTPSCIVSHLSF